MQTMIACVSNSMSVTYSCRSNRHILFQLSALLAAVSLNLPMMLYNTGIWNSFTYLLRLSHALLGLEQPQLLASIFAKSVVPDLIHITFTCVNKSKHYHSCFAGQEMNKNQDSWDFGEAEKGQLVFTTKNSPYWRHFWK